MGNGIPGAHNWSGTDKQTAEREPFASPPEMVHWSVSIVLTPRGWVGRLDNYDKQITAHLEVVQPTSFQEVETILKEKALRAPKVVTRTVPAWEGQGYETSGRFLAARNIPSRGIVAQLPLVGAGVDWSMDVIEEGVEKELDNDYGEGINYILAVFTENGDMSVADLLKECVNFRPSSFPAVIDALDGYNFSDYIEDILEQEGIDIWNEEEA